MLKNIKKNPLYNKKEKTAVSGTVVHARGKACGRLRKKK